MRLLSAIVLTLGISLFAGTASHSQWNGCQAGFCNQASGVTFQGLGDVQGSATGYYSCARAYNAAYAASLGSLCDVVDTSTGLTTCTFHSQATGFVNPSECNATACASACSVKKAYNQVNPGTNDLSNATVAQMPTISFSALNGLPGLACASGAICFLQTSGTLSLAQPLNLSAVSERTANFTSSMGIFGSSVGAQTYLGYTSTINQANIPANTGSVTATASDSHFHAINGLASGASSALNIDGGTDSTGTLGTTGISAQNLRWFRAGGNPTTGMVSMEVAVWQGTAFTQTNRQALSTNQHSTNGYCAVNGCTF